ncbi:MAG: CoA transferase [Dehalococcoidia bacterium]|nr:CoA transferase [Dehalococcoidia bacterium]
MAGGSLPLEGVRVIEIGSWVAAPAAARIMKEWGADVIKVEPLNGDGLRGTSNPARDKSVNPIFEVTNAGKRSVAINLKRPEGRATVIELVRQADVLVTNLQPGDTEKMRLDYASVSAEAPDVIYCAVTGYGRESAARDRPAFDGAAFWAASGMGGLFSEGLESPVVPRAAIGDHATAMSAVAGICAALFRRSRGGGGEFVHTSLAGNGSYALGWDLANFSFVGQAAGNVPRDQVTNPLNSFYRCGDGRWIALVNLQSDRVWPALCGALGRTELAEDARFTSARERAINAAALVAELDAAFARFDAADIGARMEAADVIWAPVHGAADLFADPDIGPLVTTECTVKGVPRRIVRVPVEFGAAPARTGGDVPEVGQDTETVLLEAGLDWEAIAKLKDAGAII